MQAVNRFKFNLLKRMVIFFIIFLLITLIFTDNIYGHDQSCECSEDRLLILQEPPLRGVDVELLQEKFIELSLYEGSADGVYNVEFAKAIAKFQESKKLTINGAVDIPTQKALAEVLTIRTEGKIVPKGEITLIIDTNKRTLTLLDDGEVYKTYPVAIGKPSTKSPIGEWAIISKSKDWGGGFGTRWLGLNVPWGIYGIHGTNKPWSIGRAASHGCFRMFNQHVEELFELVPLKTRVKVVGERLPINVNKPLRPGQFGLEVMQLQDNLQKFGFDSGYKDARYGETTEEAVKELQAQYGLHLDGIADWNVLYLLDLPEQK